NGFKEQTFNLLLEGKNPGTIFLPYEKPMQEAVHWRTHTASEQGEVIVEGDFSEPLDENAEQINPQGIIE
ncbi:glutamate 5-kinase, partial [Pseudoalteromonas aurantia]